MTAPDFVQDKHWTICQPRQWQLIRLSKYIKSADECPAVYHVSFFDPIRRKSLKYSPVFKILSRILFRQPLPLWQCFQRHSLLISDTRKGQSLKDDLMLTGHMRQQKHAGSRRRSAAVNDGVECVCCRYAGDHRRVINGQHLSKHDTDRVTYMEEYHLTPDELTAKALRILERRAPCCRNQVGARKGYAPGFP